MGTEISLLDARNLLEGELIDREKDEDEYVSEHLARYVDTIRFMAPVPPSSKVLDIGLYSGALTLLIKRYFNVKVSAVDLRSSDSEKWAGGRFKRLGIDFHFCDILTEELPFKSQEFDFVTTFELIEHSRSLPDVIFRKVHTVLRRGGVFVMSTSNIASLHRRLRLLAGKSPVTWFRDYTFEELALMLRRAGFEFVSIAFKDFGGWTRAGGRQLSSKYLIAEPPYRLITRLYPRFRNTIMIKAVAK